MLIFFLFYEYIKKNTKIMKKIKIPFIPNRWVKFIMDNNICIGLTFEYQTLDTKLKHEFIYFISETRKTEIINFQQCTDVKYLNFYADLNELQNSLLLDKKLQKNSTCDNKINFHIHSITIPLLINKQLNKLSYN